MYGVVQHVVLGVTSTSLAVGATTRSISYDPGLLHRQYSVTEKTLHYATHIHRSHSISEKSCTTALAKHAPIPDKGSLLGL